MSLILEALRKLDKDRSAPDRGVVVVGAQAWPATRRPRRGIGLVLGGLLLVAFGFWLGARPRSAAPPDTTEAKALPLPAGADSRAPDTALGTTASRVASPGPVRPREAPPTEPRPVPTRAPGGVEAEGEAADTLSSAATAANEPEESAVTVAPGRRLPRLSAIGRREERPIAIIDDRVMNEGDSFGGVTVIRIDETSVEIETAGRRHSIHF